MVTSSLRLQSPTRSFLHLAIGSHPLSAPVLRIAAPHFGRLEAGCPIFSMASFTLCDGVVVGYKQRRMQLSYVNPARFYLARQSYSINYALGLRHRVLFHQLCSGTS